MNTTPVHPAALDEDELLRQCQVVAGPNSGGPGGQNRNKVATLVTITHLPTGLSAHAGEARSQAENKKNALRRLRLALATHHRTPAPSGPKLAAPTLDDFLARLDASIGASGKPTAAASERWRARVGATRAGKAAGRITVNPAHKDYPALLAEALDFIADAGWEPKPAAQRLGVTPSQLVKLVKDHPEALVMWNRHRARKGLHGMK